MSENRGGGTVVALVVAGALLLIGGAFGVLVGAFLWR